MQDGKSMRSIARRLGRSPSTLSREVARQGAATYSAADAGKAYRTRRLRSVRRRRLVQGSELSQFVRDRLVLYRWSPQQIAAKLRNMHPDDSSQRISHETIYASIYAHPRGGLKKELVEALRQSKPTRVCAVRRQPSGHGFLSSCVSCIARKKCSSDWFRATGKAT